MLSARKRLLSKSVHYVISDHPEDISKDSIHYLAKLKYIFSIYVRANFNRSFFILSDCRAPSSPAQICCVNYVNN